MLPACMGDEWDERRSPTVPKDSGGFTRQQCQNPTVLEHDNSQTLQCCSAPACLQTALPLWGEAAGKQTVVQPTRPLWCSPRDPYSCNSITMIFARCSCGGIWLMRHLPPSPLTATSAAS